jgi:hypothetical protein
MVETWLRSAAVPLVSGPFLAISLLLALAGVMKVYRPAFTTGALRAAGIPANDILVRVLGAAEVGVGIGAVVAGGSGWAVALGLFYLAFTVFVVFALRSGAPIASCGCFGSADTPPSVAHLVVDIAATVVALVTALDPPGPWLGMTGAGAATVVPFLLFSGATVFLLYAVVNVLPQRRPQRPAPFIRLSPTRSSVSE